MRWKMDLKLDRSNRSNDLTTKGDYIGSCISCKIETGLKGCPLTNKVEVRPGVQYCPHGKLLMVMTSDGDIKNEGFIPMLINMNHIYTVLWYVDAKADSFKESDVMIDIADLGAALITFGRRRHLGFESLICDLLFFIVD
jgi:hypothetical protein